MHLSLLFRSWRLPAAAALLLVAASRGAADPESWNQYGRPLPTPEFFQPTLDPALPAYQPREDLHLSGNLVGTASNILPGLVQAWIVAFQRYYPNVMIDLLPPYVGSLGAKELIAGKVDFVFISREQIPADVTAFHAKYGYDPLSIPVAGGTYRHYGYLDAITFFVNGANPLRQVTFTQLDALLSTTRWRGGAPVRTWGDLGLTGDWADKPIHVWAVKPWNGFEEFVRERVLSVGDHRGEWRADLNFVPTVIPLAEHVAQDPYALGYAGLAFLKPGVRTLALAPVDGGPYHEATYEEVARATYPLSRLVYVNVNRGPGHPLPPALREFIRFILSREGQQVVLRQAIYLPLRENQAAASRAMLATH
jgi:ABC-type phosphate transport system substrate-binding protein